MYAFGMRLDNNSNAITVIDEENKTAETTGYVDGEYVEFSGGGSAPLVVTFTVSNDGETYTVTADKTYEQVIAAITGGTGIVCNVVQDGEEGEHAYYNLSYYYEEVEVGFEWISISIADSEISVNKIVYSASNEIDFSTDYYTLRPGHE